MPNATGRPPVSQRPAFRVSSQTETRGAASGLRQAPGAWNPRCTFGNSQGLPRGRPADGGLPRGRLRSPTVPPTSTSVGRWYREQASTAGLGDEGSPAGWRGHAVHRRGNVPSGGAAQDTRSCSSAGQTRPPPASHRTAAAGRCAGSRARSLPQMVRIPARVLRSSARASVR
jgi:hypothetical protein